MARSSCLNMICQFLLKLFLFTLSMRSHWTLLNRHVKGIIFLNLWVSMNLIWTNRRVDGWGWVLIFITDLSHTGKNRLTNHEIFSRFQLWVSRPGLQNKHCQIWFYGSNPEAVICLNCLSWHRALPLPSEFRGRQCLKVLLI